MSADKPLGQIVFYRSGEWTGVYLDGRLVHHGDHYLADEWLQERAGVNVVDSDAWLSDPDGRYPYQTVAEVEAETKRRNQVRTAAERKRREAAELLREAEEMERLAGTRKS